MTDEGTTLQEGMFDLYEEMPVMTYDGQELGLVRDVEAERFRVDAPLQPDYWLSRDDVLSVIPEERVTLRFEHAELDDRKLPD